MQRVILDTNVIVSALIQKGFPHSIVQDLYIERKIELCISENLMTEYYEVLNREKFSKFHNFRINAEIILADIANNASFFRPKKKVKIISDPDDNMLLELALECKADFLVTGNTNDFTIVKYRKTRVVVPRDYWELHRPKR